MFKTHLFRCERGVAMVEAALSLPLLLVFFLVGLELVNFAIVTMQVHRIAALAGDNASRLRTPMSESYMNQLFVGVKKAGEKLDLEQRGRLIVSSVQNNEDGDGQWIRWQRCFGNLAATSKYGTEGKGENDSSLANINGLQAQPGSALMYAEISYQYQPLLPNPVLNDRIITRDIAYIVRQRTDFSISGSKAAKC